MINKTLTAFIVLVSVMTMRPSMLYGQFQCPSQIEADCGNRLSQSSSHASGASNFIINDTEGYGGLSFTWYKISGVNTCTGLGEFGPSISVPQDGSQYRCVVYVGGLICNYYNFTAATPPPPPPPVPVNQHVIKCSAGQTTLAVVFNVSASYQWRESSSSGPLLQSGPMGYLTTGEAYVLNSAATELTIYHSDVARTFNFSVTNGNSTALNMSLTVLGPLPPISPSGLLKICSYCSQTVTAQHAPDQTYQWYLDGSPLSGATGNVITATQQGNYSVAVTAQSCSRTSNVLQLKKNLLPVANAGADQTMYPPGAFSLNGSGTDADGVIASYLWQQVSGPSVTINNPSDAQVFFSSAPEGVYVFQLTVTDDTGESATDLVTIAITPLIVACTAPIADCGPRNFTTNKTPVCSNTPTSFSFEVIDQDGGGGLSYAWFRMAAQGCEVMVGASSGSFNTPVIQKGQSETYECRIMIGANVCYSFSFNASIAPDPPPIDVVNNNVIACGSGESVLELIPAPGYTYTWTQVSTGYTLLTGAIEGLPTGEGYLLNGTGNSRLAITHGDQVTSLSFHVVGGYPGQCAGTPPSRTLTLSVVTNTVVIEAEDEKRCGDGTVMLEADGASNLTDYTWYNDLSGQPWKTGKQVESEYLSQSKTYRVTARDQYGCIGFKDVAVNHFALPPAPVIANVELCAWEPVAVAPGNGFKMNWYSNGSNEILQASHRFSRGPLYAVGQFHYEVEAISEEGCLSTKTQFVINVPENCDHRLNWIESTSYDGSGNVMGKSRSYYSNGGAVMQTQSSNLTEEKTLAQQALCDRYGRTVGNTLSAPLSHAGFVYYFNFLSNGDARPYNYKDFDYPDGAGANTILSPEPVNAVLQGSIGRYYSNNNSLEVNVPVTQYPYSRAEYYDDGTDEVKRSASAGDQHRLGAGHEAWSGTFPVFSELDDYIQKYDTAFLGVINIATIKEQGVQTVSRDENGKFAITLADKDGKVLMSCREGFSQDSVLSVTNTIVSSGDSSETEIYRPMTYFYLLHPQVVTIKGSTNFVAEDLISNTRKEPGQTFAAPDGKWPAGFYRILLNDRLSQDTITYKNYFADVSYQFYDAASRLLASVSPNGYKKWKAEPSNYQNIDKTTYKYNHRGWLLEMTEPDAGKTAYQYRRDSRIRFSQNALQRENESAATNNDKGKFSYTHYDALGRPVESGEYTGNAYLFGSLGNQLEYDQQIEFGGNRRDWIKTIYDVPDTAAIPNLPAGFKQEFVRGAVSYTENANIKTWYSYDAEGRVKWMAQKPVLLNRTFVTEYTYSFPGQVLTVRNSVYDVNHNVLDLFYHHYQYDADQRLSRSYTSTDSTTLKLRATYQYYLHGPLKRIELGDSIQGIDFVYNINGWLTQINHPDRAQDPGGDTNDAFGMVLDYYESDMEGLFPVSLNPTKLFDPLKIHHLPQPEDFSTRALFVSQDHSYGRSEGHKYLKDLWIEAQEKNNRLKRTN